jgi:FixJ family two-component response regulator
LRAVGGAARVVSDVRIGRRVNRLPEGHLPACLILDIALPGISGLDFQRQRHGLSPDVFITDTATSIVGAGVEMAQWLSAKPSAAA